MFKIWCNRVDFSCNEDDIFTNYSVFCMKLQMINKLFAPIHKGFDKQVWKWATGLSEYLIFDKFISEMTIHNGSDFFSEFVTELIHFVTELVFL